MNRSGNAHTCTAYVYEEKKRYDKYVDRSVIGIIKSVFFLVVIPYTYAVRTGFCDAISVGVRFFN